MKKFIVGLMPFIMITVGFATSPFFVRDSVFWYLASMVLVISGVILLFSNIIHGLYDGAVAKILEFLYED